MKVRGCCTALLVCIMIAGCGGQGVPATPVPAPTVTPAGAQTKWPPDLTAFLPAGAQTASVEEVDTDGDRLGEMVVIYRERGTGRGLVIRREGDGGRGYPLGGSTPAGLFRASLKRSTVRDINADGKIEIMVEGANGGRSASVNVFQWNGSAYASLLSLSGEEGVAVDDTQNRGVYDFTALELLFRRSGVMRATHAEWKQAAYQLRSDVLFVLGIPLVFNYPEEAALAYYLFLGRGEPDKAYGLLAEPQKSIMPPGTLRESSRGLESVSVETLTIEEEQADAALVSLSVVYVDRASRIAKALKHVWRLQREGKEWRLAELGPQ